MPALHARIWRPLGSGALAVAVTWPLAARMGSRLPIGNEPVATVARFNLWTLEWNARGFGPFRAGYWNAPIFSPARGTFAFSDPQILTGAVFHILTAIGIGASVAYGCIVLAALTLNGVAASAVLEDAGVSFGAATLAGALMVALPFTANEFGVLQLLMVWPVLFGLGAALRYFRTPDWRPAALVGLWIAIAFLTSEYYAFFLLVALAIVAIVMLVGTRPRLAQLAHAGVAVGTALVLVGPFVLMQSSRIENFAWPEATVEGLGASLHHWFRLSSSALGSEVPLIGAAHGTELALYPGTVILVLAYFGVAATRRAQLRWMLSLLAVATVTFLLAAGLGLELSGFAPYELLRDHVPGFGRIRSPYRFAVITQMCIVLVAGIGLDAMSRWWKRAGTILAVALTALAVVEVVQLPMHTAPAVRAGESDWVDYLARHPDGVAAMVPFPAGPSSVDYADTTTAMLLGLEHGHPLVNGYSGFFPHQYIELRKAMRDFPSAATVAELENLDVEWIVVDNAWLTDARAERMRDLGFTDEPQFAGAERSVYAMPDR